MTKLLIDEPPLQVLPSLAVKYGLPEAIIIQQVHYWLRDSKHEKEGFIWIFNSYPAWQKQFPFWTEKTIRRTIKSLEDTGILVSGNFNKNKIDRTKWYRLDYLRFGQTIRTNCPDHVDSLTPPLPEIVSQSKPTEKEPTFFDDLKSTEKIYQELKTSFTDYFQIKYLEAHKMKPEFPPFRWLWVKVRALLTAHPQEEVFRRVDNFFADPFMITHTFKQFMDDPDKFVVLRTKFENGNGKREYIQPKTDWEASDK